MCHVTSGAYLLLTRAFTNSIRITRGGHTDKGMPTIRIHYCERFTD